MDTRRGASRTALVTGGTSGIGFHTAAALCARGFQVFVTGRDEARGKSALAALRETSKAEFVAVDHSSMAANRDLASLIAERTGRRDVLVNNVGALLPRRVETAEGLESTLAINFAGPAALTLGLLPLLKATDGPRVVNVVSSSLFMWKRPLFEDLESRECFVGIDVHARAKLLNLIWTVALARKMSGKVAANAVNPGMAWTAMTQSLTPEAVPAWRFIWPLVRFFQKRASPADAASGPIRLALAEDAAAWSGVYFDGKPKPLPPVARDESIQEQVWKLGTELANR